MIFARPPGKWRSAIPHEHHLFQFDVDAVLFDLDGVLVDSRHCVERHWLEWAGQHHLNTDKVLHYAHGRRTVETIRLVAPYLNVEREATELETEEAYDTAGLVKIPGALELLQSIPPDAWGIATSGTHATASTRLAFGGLPVPDVLISAEDVVAGKPDPEPYLFAAIMLGVKPASCVVIEDTPAGIQAGRAAGMHVVGVISSAYPAEELSQAQVVVRKLGDIEVVQAQKTGLARLIVRVKGI
ncbi:MAG TPA: HAD-IA family hydrolase [Anaerolineaceae bacterium]|jgi:mannitol-1-/sugar-/sorbitol-6-phosphatase